MIHSSITISCQKCGGVADVVAGQEYHRCEFCTSLIRLCEVSVDRILPTGAIVESCCPSCSQSLETGLIEGRRAMYCTSCFGVLVRYTDFGGIVHSRQAKRVGVEPAEPKPIDPAAFQRHLKCPSCSTQMEVHPYYGPGNIVVDTCHECGFVWLDHGELTRVEKASGVRSATPFASSGDGTMISGPGSTSSRYDEPETTTDSPLRFLADLFL